jgi:hypothetical protein
MQTQIQRMGGMSSAVIGGFCEHSPVVHELVAKFADMTAKDTAKEHGRQLKEATAYQRHRIRQRLATGAWRDFHENKIARLPYVDPTSTKYARTAASPRTRHQIESPKRSPKESAQGRLPHYNNGSTNEFLSSQRWQPEQPIGHMRQTTALQKGSSGHDECAAEEGAKGAACGAFISS